MYSDYSGLAGKHKCMFGISKALQTYDPLEDYATAVQFSRFSDMGAAQQEVLEAISSCYGNNICVLGNLNNRLPPEARSLLDAMLPSEKVAKAKLVKAYANMEQYLMENRAWLFPMDAKTLTNQPGGNNLLRVVVSREEKLGNPLFSSHHVLHIVVSATDLGWPVRRRRVFTCGLSKASMIWLGPPQEQVLDHFKSFFAAQMEATADVFLFADEADVAKEIGHLASKRGFSLKENPNTAAIPLSQMYAPGQLLRYSAYENLRQSTQGEDLTWFADLEQNCGAGASTPGRILPSMLTHGTVHAWRASRKMTHRELYQARGYFMKDSSSPIADVLGRLSPRVRQLLLGNGWHLAVMGSWLLYILMHCVRINRNMTVQPERSLSFSGMSAVSASASASAPPSTTSDGESRQSSPSARRTSEDS
ncbi:unnamed protein product [Symbiodinium sp. CCMP2456]|nr:unnamed protein product [Symbiodinium sp. CCMP2456]